MSQPIPVMVRRYECPHCGRRRASKRTVEQHTGRCWRNPEARGCLTCRHFLPGEPGEPEVGYVGTAEGCAAGVDLSGRGVCDGCGGEGDVPIEPGAALGMTACPECGGDGVEVKPGPITGCDLWTRTEG